MNTAAHAARVILSAFPFAAPEPNRAYCPDCKGTGRRKGACRRCRGKGYTTVGRTKR